MLHPPSPLAIRTQDAQRFIVFSYFVPAECPVSTEATADVSAGKREDLSTDTHLSSMLHRYLPHFFNDDSIPPQQTVEGTTEDSDAPVAISNIKEEDIFYPFSLPPLAQRFIGNSFNVPETSQPAVSATECRVAKVDTAGTATVKRENRWAARILPSVLPPCLPPVVDNDFMPLEHTVEDAYEVSFATEATSGRATVDGVDRSAAKCPVPMLPPSLPLVFDIDYKLPGTAVEGTNKCPVASEAAASVSTVLQEEFLADKGPPAPTALSLRLPCTHNIDHKQPEETVENTTECSVDIEACAVASTVKREEMMGDKSPVHALPPSLACIHDKDHKQPDQKGRGTIEEVDICPHVHQLVSDAKLTLATCNDEPPTPLICEVTKMPVRVGASICSSEDEEPRPWTLEEVKDYWIGIENESEERSVTEEMSPREGLKSEADCAHSKCSNGTVSSERAESILGRVGFLLMNHMQKIPFLKMEEKEKNRIKKEKKCSEELKKREKAQAAFLEMERKIQEKEEKKSEKMRKRLEKKRKREPAGG
uniref:uncharacterized protein LOC124010704 n=1 Tax=Oncorhynchus gorbuscha TaxID=8017 RepID=UPI001EAF5319|nr:uncharacterized protein LOC124010704 [Oncorhynchus gorbuscha]